MQPLTDKQQDELTVHAYKMYLSIAKWNIKNDETRWAKACEKWENFQKLYPVPLKYMACHGIFTQRAFRKFLTEFWSNKSYASHKQYIAINAKYAGNVVRDVHIMQKKPLNKKLYKQLEKQEFDIMTASMKKMEDMRDKKKKELAEQERREQAELRKQFANFVKKNEFSETKKLRLFADVIADAKKQYESETDPQIKTKLGDKLINMLYDGLDRYQSHIDVLESRCDH